MTVPVPANLRDIHAQLRTLLEGSDALKTRYAHAKQVVRAFRRPAFYEIETRCNLKCEGCYYFEGGQTQAIPTERDVPAWERFFAAEAERGVTMAYFVGAEPALAQDRLLAAAERFPFGNIGSNGTIRIDPAVDYRIGVSVWAGEDASDRRLRGASVFRKALRNYAGDPRAIMLFTVSRWTVHQVDTVAELCADHGLPLTFNVYSPTQRFMSKLNGAVANDDGFFRVSQPGQSPILAPEDLDQLRGALDRAITRFPQTVVYSKAYNDFIMRPGPRYKIDPETGVAQDCKSRILDPMRYHTVDLQQADVKCCTPDVDCRECRMYSGGWSSRFIPRAEDVATPTAFSDWLETLEVLGRIFLYGPSAPLPPGARDANA